MNGHHRWSDDQLQQFRDEYVAHLEEDHAVQATLKEAIENNTRIVNEIHANTSDMVDAWRALGWLGRAIKWIAGIVAAFWLVLYTITHGAPPK